MKTIFALVMLLSAASAWADNCGNNTRRNSPTRPVAASPTTSAGTPTVSAGTPR